jgi:hypothetical protein
VQLPVCIGMNGPVRFGQTTFDILANWAQAGFQIKIALSRG